MDGDYYLTKNGTSTLIKTSNLGNIPALEPDEHYYFYIIAKDQTTNINQHVFHAGDVDLGSSIITFHTDSLFDTYNNISIEKIYSPNENLTSLGKNPYMRAGKLNSGIGSCFSFNIDFSKSLFTSTVFIKDNKIGPTIPAAYDYLEIKKKVSSLNQGVAYSVLATSPYANTIGYNYPVYLKRKDGSDLTINFSEFPGVDFYTPPGTCFKEITSNYYYRPPYYKKEKLVNFNEEILTSSAKYSNNYIKIDSEKNYFLSDLKTINSGTCYEKNELYNLYSKDFSKDYSLKISGVSSGARTVSSAMSVIYNQSITPSTVSIKIIRGNSAIVSGGTGSVLNFTTAQGNVRDYFEMIKYQNFTSEVAEFLVFQPEKNLSLLANYDVFKSPYIINSDSTKTFLCYDEAGRSRPEGYVSEITTNGSKVYTNLACPNNNVGYEVEMEINGKLVPGEAFCGAKGIKNKDGTSLLHCTQGRDNKAVNFYGTSQQCIISKDFSEYNTINNQLGFGLFLDPIAKALGFGKKPTKNIGNINTYPSYFTKQAKVNKNYGPGEEFFIEKSSNNYYISLSNNNLNFVDNIDNWRRVFIFENNLQVSPYQYFFNTHPPKYKKNTINLGLGRFPGAVYTDLMTNESSDLDIAFNTETPGITSQSYLNQGITYFCGAARRQPDSTDISSAAFKSSFITNLRTAGYRIFYNSPYFVYKPAPEAHLYKYTTPNPAYYSIKFRDEKEPRTETLTNSSPIFSTFDIVKKDKIVFTSKFYDSNLNVPWSSQVFPGDYFNPDFIYFNNFIYSFLFSEKDGDKYGTFQPKNGSKPMTVPTVLERNLLKPSDPKDPNLPIFQSGNIFYFIQISKGEKSPEISDYILLIPYEPRHMGGWRTAPRQARPRLPAVLSYSSNKKNQRNNRHDYGKY